MKPGSRSIPGSTRPASWRGHRLRIGTGADPGRFLGLPPESAAAGPFGRLVLVVADDGRASTIRAIDRGAGCAWTIATSPDVVRRITLDAAGANLYEHRLDRRSRADLGVWRRPLDGSAPERVLGPLPADRDVGMTFSTTLGWSAEGDRLVVQQCGALRCRTRLLDPATGASVTLAGTDHGELVGVAGGRVVSYATCPGLPCPLEATDVAGGRQTVLDRAAALARLVVTADGPRVAVETGIEGGTLRVVRLDGSLDATFALPDPALRLMPGADRAVAGTRLPPGWLVVAPDGRSPDGAVLTRLSDGATVGLREVTR